MTSPTPAPPRTAIRPDGRAALGAARGTARIGRPRETVQLWRAGRLEYGAALAWQRATAEAVAAGRLPAGSTAGASEARPSEVIALLEHPPTYTFGVRGGREHLLATPAVLAARGAEVVDSDRGGDVTFHGPGQLVAYPILDLRARELRAGAYVRCLEAAVIASLEAFGVRGERVPGRPGVWVEGAKIAALGVRISHGVSRHGLALNVTTDLAWFEQIVPCGIADAAVTSLERVLGAAPALHAVEDALAAAFERVFAIRLVEPVDEPAELREAAGDAD